MNAAGRRLGRPDTRRHTGKEATVDFNSVLIGSEDPDKLVAYYTKLFGDPTFSEGGYTGWEIGSGTITIGPHSEVNGRSRAARAGSS